MILEADNIKIDYFDRLLKGEIYNNKIAVSFTGGVDSSLLTYVLCESIMRKNMQSQIKVYCFNANNTRYENENYSIKPAQKCYDILVNMFPEIQFEGLHFYDYFVAYKQEKKLLLRKTRDQFKLDFDLDVILLGTTRKPPEGQIEALDKLVSETPALKERDYSIKQVNNLKKNREPFKTVDKSYLFKIYKQFDLLESLYPYTVSCTRLRNGGITPCQICYWCLEKKWGFGSYDGGVVD